MDEKRVAELRLIQAAIALHVSEIAYQKAVEGIGIFSVESRLRGERDFEAERGEYVKRRIELTLACEQYAELFTPKLDPENKTGPALNKPGDVGDNSAMQGDYTSADPADFECTCDHMLDEGDDVVATIRDKNCPIHGNPAPAKAKE